jgi:hypothetical protein
MKKLKNYGVQELGRNDQINVNGGNIFYDWLLGEAIGAVVDFISSDNEGYGRRMYETGSPGGHK